MKLTVRLYKRHDLDLLFLYKQNSDFDFRAKMKSALKSYVKHKPEHNEIPVGTCQAVSELPSVVQLHIMLDMPDDEDIMAWVKGITKGRRNNMIKNVFRNTFPPIEAPYKQLSESHKFTEGEDIYGQ